jgi:sporulation protein YlmC with PRC-barrel domain
MRLSDLRDCKVKTIAGKTLGRVHDVHCDGGKVVELMCGAPSLIERLTAKAHGRRVKWEEVVRVERGVVVIGPPPKGASGARTRPGTRQASGSRSKR